MMKKTIFAICLIVASFSLSAQELLDFSQPDPVSATPTRTTKLFRYTPALRLDNTYFLRGGTEYSASIVPFNFEIRPWRNQHYFSVGLGADFASAYLGSRHYSISDDILSFDPADDGSLGMNRLGFSLPLTYGFDIKKRKSLEFSIILHCWPALHLTNEYRSGAQFDYAKAQGLVKDGHNATIGTYYEGHNPFTVDFSVAYYLTANCGISVKYAPPMLFNKGTGPSYHAFSYGAIIRF